MKKILPILFLALFPFFSFAFTIPEKPTGFVQDYAKILTSEQVVALETKISAFEKSTTNEIAVVTIPSLDGDTIENVAQELFTKWGIGKEGKNNGVLLLIPISDRETRIHTGYGVEGDLTDIGTSYIQQDIITPAFRNGDYYGGINGAVDKMIEALGGADIVPENYSRNVQMDWSFLIYIFIILAQFIFAILAKTKSWWLGGVFGAVIGLVLWYANVPFVSEVLSGILTGVLIVIGLILDFFVSKSYQNAKANGTHHLWFGGGGFGGFGGGSFSGGGASRGF